MSTQTSSNRRSVREHHQRVEELLLVTEAIGAAKASPTGVARTAIPGGGQLTVTVLDDAMIVHQRGDGLRRTALVETTMAPYEVLEALEAATVQNVA